MKLQEEQRSQERLLSAKEKDFQAEQRRRDLSARRQQEISLKNLERNEKLESKRQLAKSILME